MGTAWRALFRSAALAGVACLSLSPRVSVAAELQKIEIGIPGPLNTILAFWMADEADLYKQQGIAIAYKLTAGGSLGAAMLQSGAIQVMQAGLSSVVDIDSKGGDIRTIGSLSNVNRFTLFGAPGVRSAADLKGGTFAISTPGSETDTTATIMLEKLGLKRSDVIVKGFGAGEARLAALKSGAAKASPLNEPGSTRAKDQRLPILVDLASENFPWLFSSIVVSETWLRANRALAFRFMKATVEGNFLAVHDEARAKAVLARRLSLKNPTTVDIVYNDFKTGTPPTTEWTPRAVSNILKYVTPNSGKPSDYVDASLLQDLRREGFFDEMAKKYSQK